MAEPNNFKDTLALIAGFLQRGESCFLPGIGVLYSKYQSAYEKGHKIYPPTTEILLTQDQSKSQHAIIHELEKHLQLNNEVAKKIWNEVLKEIKEKDTVLILGIGTLSQDETSTFIFTTKPTPSFYQPIEQPEEQLKNPEYDVDPLHKEKKSRKRKVVFFTLLAIIVILLIGSFIYFYYANTEFNKLVTSYINPQEETLVENNNTPTSEGFNKHSKDTSMKAETSLATDSIDKGTSTDSISFVVVYRKYTSKASALKDARQKVKWGYHVAAYTKDSVYYLVGYPYFALPADTAEKIKEKDNIYGIKTFAIYPEKQGYKKITNRQ